MKEFFTWASSTISTSYTNASQLGNQFLSSIQSAGSYLTSKEVLQEGKQVGAGGLRGLNPGTAIALRKMTEAKGIFNLSAVHNLVHYMGPVLVFEAGKQIFYYASPMLKDSYLGTAIEVLEIGYFVRKVISMYVDNTAYNAALAKAFNKEHPHAETLEPCKEKPSSDILASLSTLSCHAINVTLAYVIKCSVPVIGPAIYYPMRCLIDGRGLLDYKFSSVSMCSSHRREVLRNNKSYSLGLGLSLLGMVQGLRQLIGITGADNYFIHDAIYYVVYQYLIMQALSIDTALPGEKHDKDIFDWQQEGVDALIRIISKKVVPYLMNQDSEVDWGKLKDDICNSLPIRIIKKLFIESDLQDLYQFLKRPAIKLYFQTTKEDYESAMSTVIEARDSPSAGVALYLPFVISKRTRQVISVLRQEELDGYITELNKIVNFIYAENPIIYTATDAPHQNKVAAHERALTLMSAERDDQLTLRLLEPKPSALTRAQSLPQVHMPVPVRPANLLLFDRPKKAPEDDTSRRPHTLRTQLSDSNQEVIRRFKKGYQ